MPLKSMVDWEYMYLVIQLNFKLLEVLIMILGVYTNIGGLLGRWRLCIGIHSINSHHHIVLDGGY